MGGSDGIFVNNTGMGTTTVMAANSTGTNGFGILVFGSTGDLSVTSTGTATGGVSGIDVVNNLMGTTTVMAADSIGAGLDGIDVFGGTTSGNLSVTSTGTAMGGSDGIEVVNLGMGLSLIHI